MGQAGPICSQVPDEGREVREMCGWDLCGGRQMLQTVHRKGPRRTIAEDLSDPVLLRAGEHGGRYRSRRRPCGPANPVCPSTALVDSIVAPTSQSRESVREYAPEYAPEYATDAARPSWREEGH